METFSKASGYPWSYPDWHRRLLDACNSSMSSAPGTGSARAKGSARAFDGDRTAGKSTAEGDLASHLHRLQRGLTGERRAAGMHYQTDKALRAAYLLYYWPISYFEASIVFEACTLKANKVLDLCAGTGAASAACMDIGATDFTLVDHSKEALVAARDILTKVKHSGSGAHSSQKPITFKTYTLDLEKASAKDLEALGQGFDMIVISNGLNELWKNDAMAVAKRAQLFADLSKMLAPEGLVVSIEPATRDLCRAHIALRDMLVGNGWHVQSPCPAIGECPMLKRGPDRVCYLERSWQPPESIATLANAAGLDRDALKFSYFVLSPHRPAHALMCNQARVVSEPMLNKAGKTRYFVCNQKGISTFDCGKAPIENGGQMPAFLRYDVIDLATLRQSEEHRFVINPEVDVRCTREFGELSQWTDNF